MSIEFEKLLFRAEVNKYQRHLWFGDCALVANVILCPDAKTRDTLERLFGAQLRAVTSDVTFRVGALPSVTSNAGPLPKERWRVGDMKERPAFGKFSPPAAVSRKPDLLDE